MGFAHSLTGTKEAAMLKRFVSLAGLALLLSVMFVPAAHAQTRFSVQIGPVAPVVVAARPPYGYVWQPGYYVWTGYHRRWVRGGWVRPYVRDGWTRERWERRHRAFDGDWNRDRGRRDWDRDGRVWRR
jgi:hypothetical protein